MELKGNNILWRAFTDELEKIAAGKMPNPAQLMKRVSRPPQMVRSSSPTPITSPVLSPPPGASIKTGPQMPFVAQPAPQVTQVAQRPLLGGQSNVLPSNAYSRTASGSMMR